MVLPFDVLAAHLAALLCAWACAWGTGLPLAWLLRVRIGFAGSPLLGVAYWAAALYCLPFSGGLTIAAAIAGLMVVWVLLQGDARQSLRASIGRLGRADLILGIGCAAYLSILFIQYVPPGMDGAMHTIAARLIAQQSGLPISYAPFAPDLPFPPINLGLSAFAAVVIRGGADPASAMLACEHLTFSCLLLGCYVLLRVWVPRTSAALPAVIAAWTARNAQETAGWGGFPTVMSVALALLATRLLFDVARRPQPRAAVGLGLVLAAAPLVHSAGAASWLYGVAPVAGVVAFFWTRRKSAALRNFAFAAIVGSLILGAYLIGSKPTPNAAQLAWVHDWHRGYAPDGDGWQLALATPNYVKSSAGSVGIYAGLLGVAMLLIRRRFVPVVAAGAVTLLLCALVANARHDWLPGSFLLFPERVVYWAPPLAALMMALGWRALPAGLRGRPIACWSAAVVLLALALPRQHSHFQRIALAPTMNADEWETLCWARDHLEPGHAYVAASYNSTGSYLPAVAGIACSGWPLHYLCFRDELLAYGQRAPTHALVDTNATGDTPGGDVVVFRRGQVVLCTRNSP